MTYGGLRHGTMNIMLPSSSSYPLVFIRQFCTTLIVLSQTMPLAMLIVLGLLIGFVSGLFGLPGGGMALEFITNGTEPIVFVQIFFLGIVYAIGPLCLLPSRDSIQVLVRHVGGPVQSYVCGLRVSFAPMRGSGHLLSASPIWAAVCPVRLALAATPTTHYSPGESPQLE